MIKRFQEFSSSLQMNEAKNVTFNELERLDNLDSGEYLRNVMWDKSIKLFYGKDYKGNPEKDIRMIPSVSASSSSMDISFGDVFKDAWVETDGFCDVGSFRSVFVWGDIATSSKIQKTILELDPNLVLGWLTESGTKVMPSDPSIFVVPTSIEDSAAKVAKKASEFFSKRTIKVDRDATELAKTINDRDKVIRITQLEIEDERDFEPDWGLDSWTQYVTEMPGWGKVYQVEADKIGHWFSLTMAEAIFRFAEIKFGVSILKAAQQMIKRGQITADQINSGTKQPVPSTGQATTVVSDEPKPAPAAPKPAAPKPAAPRPAAPKPTAARKRPNYD